MPKCEARETEILYKSIELLEEKYSDQALIIRHNNFSKRFKGRKVKSNSYGAGFPDVVFYSKKHTIFIEFKSSTGRQSKEQKEFERKCRERQMFYLIVRSPLECMDLVGRIMESEGYGEVSNPNPVV